MEFGIGAVALTPTAELSLAVYSCDISDTQRFSAFEVYHFRLKIL